MKLKKSYKHSIFEILGTQLDTKPNSILFTKIAISASPNQTSGKAEFRVEKCIDPCCV